MNLFIYSDESGVFDAAHNKYFVFGGLVFLSKIDKDDYSRLYINAERTVRLSEGLDEKIEVKATTISNTSKAKLFRSLNKCYKFGVIIDQKKVNRKIFGSKKDKQRYLDYAYKIAVKNIFCDLIKKGIINRNDIERLYFFVDEHSTATNGKYELRESLEQEFKNGTYNFNYRIFYPPIFENLCEVNVSFCSSESQTLIRAADIVANKLYYLTLSGKINGMPSDNLFITMLP